MDLDKWIDQVGAHKVAEIMNVSLDTVYMWRRGQTSPQTMTAYKLIELSHGVITWEGVFKPFVRARIAERKEHEQITMQF